MLCSKCRFEKETTEFAPNKSRKSGYQSMCKDCYAVYQRDYYRQRVVTDEAYRVHKKNWRKLYTEARRIENQKKLFAYFEKHPCVICGEKDPIVLQSDHRDGVEKKFNIGDAIPRLSWQKIEEELMKCDTMCTNCHTRRTALQFNWYPWYTLRA
jgi:hypothetical protein